MRRYWHALIAWLSIFLLVVMEENSDQVLEHLAAAGYEVRRSLAPELTGPKDGAGEPAA
jgi:hypothetical protein